MRLTPERLRLLGQRPRERHALTLKARTPGLSTLLGRSLAWYLQARLKAGHAIEYVTEMDPDYLTERIRSRYDQDRARSGRTTSTGPNASNVRGKVFIEPSTNSLEVRVLEGASLFDAHQEHYVSMGTSVPCRAPCPLCITQGVQKSIPHGWKWKT